jgi:hypothetical protein
MATPTYQEVLDSKTLSNDILETEFKKLCKYDANKNERCFAGNSILYHYQLDNLCKVKVKGKSFYETMMDDEKREKTWIMANKYANGSRPNNPALRLFEVYRRCSGAVVFFKPTVAMYVYKQMNATSVLDFTAGWGGRLLGAQALGIQYTGIDTNTDLKPAYDEMLKRGGKMIWDDALNVDFSQIDYDCVLTSPPYINLEIYPHMSEWKSSKVFYTDFLIPLIEKSRKHIRRNGKVCINISPSMYEDLIKFGYEPCKQSINMLQQKVRGKDKKDMIYVW